MPSNLDEKDSATGIVKIAQVDAASGALAAAVMPNTLKLLSRNMPQLYFFKSIDYLVTTMNGSNTHRQVMESINAMVPYQGSFGLSGEGSATGEGSVSSSGVRTVVIIGTAVQTYGQGTGQFIGGGCNIS